MMAKSRLEAKRDDTAAAFLQAKKDYRAGNIAEVEYRAAGKAARDARAQWREKERDKDGYSPVSVGG